MLFFLFLSSLFGYEIYETSFYMDILDHYSLLVTSTQSIFALDAHHAIITIEREDGIRYMVSVKVIVCFMHLFLEFDDIIDYNRS